MASISGHYLEEAPPCRFIGLAYSDSDRIGHSFGHLWQDWFGSQRFDTLKPLITPEWEASFPEAGSYLGLMRYHEDKPFEYWIGLFCPPDSPVPEGFAALDLPALTYFVCLITGKEPEIFWQIGAVNEKRQELGLPMADYDGKGLFLERYVHPRFTEKDEEGNQTLDILYAIEAPVEASAKVSETDLSKLRHCARDYLAFEEAHCPVCDAAGLPLAADDPIYIGELPGPLRNAMQIAFSASDIPFTALPNQGVGFTMSAGDIFESYRIYVPFERSIEAEDALNQVLDSYRH